MSQVIPLREGLSAETTTDFAQVEILVYANGNFTIDRQGNYPGADEDLSQAIGAMQLKIAMSAR